MFRGRLLVKSVLKRAVVTSSISGAFVLPAVTISQNVNNLPRVSIDFKTRSFVSSKVVNEVVVNDPPSGPSPNLVGRSSIFVGNLDFSVTEDQIMEMCYGMLGPKKALMARIAIDRDTGKISWHNAIIAITTNISTTRLMITVCDFSFFYPTL